jgi:hypothetical protein
MMMEEEGVGKLLSGAIERMERMSWEMAHCHERKTRE